MRCMVLVLQHTFVLTDVFRLNRKSRNKWIGRAIGKTPIKRKKSSRISFDFRLFLSPFSPPDVPSYALAAKTTILSRNPFGQGIRQCCSSKATTRHRVFILSKIYLMSQRICLANPSRFAFSGAPCLRKNLPRLRL